MASPDETQSALEFSARDVADCRIVSVAGKVDHTNSDKFLEEIGALSESIAGSGGMVVDLARVDFITSAGLRALLLAQRTVKGAGGNLVVCGVSGVVKEVFRISKFDALLSVTDDTAAAVAMISPAAAEAFSG